MIKRSAPSARVPSQASKTEVVLPKPSTSDFWAFLSICSFPAGMIIANVLGYGPMASLAFGALASLAAVIVNVLTETRLWMFHPDWRARFEHPDFSFRIAVVTGAILLILQTGLIVMVATDTSLDQALMRVILNRQCVRQSTVFKPFCDVVQQIPE